MDIVIENQIRPMAYPTITINELKTHLEKIKKTKQLDLTTSKRTIQVHCTTLKRHMQKETTQHTTEHISVRISGQADSNKTKVETWEKSNTTMVHKVKKPQQNK